LIPESARALTSSNQRIDAKTETLVVQALTNLGHHGYPSDRGDGAHLIAFAIGSHAGTADGDQSNRSHASGGPVGSNISEELAYTVRNGRGQSVAFAFDTTQITHPENRSNPQPDGPSPSLARGAHPPAITFSAKDHGADAGEIAPTLRAGGHAESHANGGTMPAIAFDARQRHCIQYGEKTGPLDTDGQTIGVHVGIHVRRLTPLECERLQGFPDNYTLIPYKGRLAADGPRYKALGNSMAVPVMRWIGKRLLAVEAIA
jgi:site-specific DNA-cytosine methylase